MRIIEMLLVALGVLPATVGPKVVAFNGEVMPEHEAELAQVKHDATKSTMTMQALHVQLRDPKKLEMLKRARREKAEQPA